MITLYNPKHPWLIWLMISFPIQIAVNWGPFHMSGQTLTVISEQVTTIIYNQ